MELIIPNAKQSAKSMPTTVQHFFVFSFVFLFQTLSITVLTILLQSLQMRIPHRFFKVFFKACLY